MGISTSIKSRLLGGMMLIVLFFLVQAGLVWHAIEDAKSTVVENTRKNTLATSELGLLAVQAQQVRRYEKEYFVWVGNKVKRNAYEREWRDGLGKIDTMLARMKTGSDGAFSASDIEQIDKWRAASNFYAAEMQKIYLAVAERETGVRASEAANIGWLRPAEHVAYRPDEVNEMIKAGKDRFTADLIKGVTAMSQTKTMDTLALADVARQLFSKLLIGVMFTVIIGVIVVLLLGILLPRMVTKTIAGLSSAAQEMSMGNLKNEYNSGGVSEFIQLAEALNRMRLGQLALVERLQKRR